jgi:hypothetical protein
LIQRSNPLLDALLLTNQLPEWFFPVNPVCLIVESKGNSKFYHRIPAVDAIHPCSFWHLTFHQKMEDVFLKYQCPTIKS